MWLLILKIVLSIFAGMGLTNILMNSTLLEPLRDKCNKIDELLSCPMCSGVWAGLIAIGLVAIHPLLTIPFIVSILVTKGNRAA